MYRSIMKNRNILLYLASAGISQLGNVLSGLAFLFLSYELTESGSLTTIVAIAQALPYLLFGLIGGALADRVQKKRLIIILDVIRIPILLLLVVLYHGNLLSFWYVIVASFIIQTIGCFYNPAFRAIFPQITPLEDQTTANGMLDTVTRGVQVLTPLFSISLINSGQISYFFIIDALTYILSVLCMFKLTFKDTTPSHQEQPIGLFRSVFGFISWVKTNYTIRILFIVTFLMVLCNTWIWQVGLLLQLIDSFDKGEEYYSLLLGWYGLGVIVINLIIPFIWKKMSLKIYLTGSLIWGTGLLVLGFSNQLAVYFIGVFIVAIGIPIVGLARVYLIQTLVPADRLGRAFSFNAVLLYTSNVISLGLFGFLYSFVGTKALFIMNGGSMIIIAALYLFLVIRTKETWRHTI